MVPPDAYAVLGTGAWVDVWLIAAVDAGALAPEVAARGGVDPAWAADAPDVVPPDAYAATLGAVANAGAVALGACG